MAIRTGIIHRQLKSMNKSLSHAGYDIRLTPTAERRVGKNKSDAFELNDFEFISNFSTMTAPSYRKERVKDLYDSVLNKYYKEEHKVSEEIKKDVEEQRATRQGKKVIKELKDGKVIKALMEDENGDIYVTTWSDDEEVQRKVNTLFGLYSTAEIMLKKQILECKNKLKVGTLDIKKSTGELVIWKTPNETEPAPQKISLNTLKASIWFAAGLYNNAPSYRKFLNLDVSEGKYTARFVKGIFKYDTENLDETELAIVEDIKKL